MGRYNLDKLFVTVKILILMFYTNKMIKERKRREGRGEGERKRREEKKKKK